MAAAMREMGDTVKLRLERVNFSMSTDPSRIEMRV